jgi:hypothetical protein
MRRTDCYTLLICVKGGWSGRGLFEDSLFDWKLRRVLPSLVSLLVGWDWNPDTNETGYHALCLVRNVCLVSDIAVGAFESGHAVVLRGHPIITFQPTLATSTSRISMKTSNFSSTACLSYTGSYVPNTVGKHMLHCT